MTGQDFLFTSESVTEGHPDKICDQISDSVLDAIFTDDPMGRVAVETLVTTGLVRLKKLSQGNLAVSVARTADQTRPQTPQALRQLTVPFVRRLSCFLKVAAGSI